MIKQKFKDKHMSETMCVDKSNLLYEAESLMNFLPVSASSYVFGCQFFIISFWCCCHWWKNWYICHEWWSCDYKLTTTAFLLRPCFYMICIRSWSPNLFIVCVLDLFWIEKTGSYDDYKHSSTDNLCDYTKPFSLSLLSDDLVEIYLSFIFHYSFSSFRMFYLIFFDFLCRTCAPCF